MAKTVKFIVNVTDIKNLNLGSPRNYIHFVPLQVETDFSSWANPHHWQIEESIIWKKLYSDSNDGIVSPEVLELAAVLLKESNGNMSDNSDDMVPVCTVRLVGKEFSKVFWTERNQRRSFAWNFDCMKRAEVSKPQLYFIRHAKAMFEEIKKEGSGWIEVNGNRVGDLS